jgi:hypothetical protein
LEYKHPDATLLPTHPETPILVSLRKSFNQLPDNSQEVQVLAERICSRFVPLLRFGTASKRLRVAVAELPEWVANELTQ